MPPFFTAFARLWRPARVMLDPAALRPGDLILSTVKAGASAAIRLATWSPYSHAAIALGHGIFAEAVGMGVRRRSVNTIVNPRLLVLRLDARRCPDAEAIAEQAALRVELHLHQEYWVSGALRARFLRTPPDRRGRMFCSQLAAQVYRDAGNVALAPRKAPESTTPGDIARSPMLREVEAAVHRADHVPDFLLDEHFQTLADRETLAVQAAFAKACAWAEAQGIVRPAGWIDLQVMLADLRPSQRQQALDRLLAQWLVEDGYFRLIAEAANDIVAPLQRIAEAADRRAMSAPAARMEFDLLRHGCVALAQQQASETDNAAFYREQSAAAPLQTFELMALRSDANAAVAQRAVEAVDAILAALAARYGFAAGPVNA